MSNRYGNDLLLQDGDILSTANGDLFTAKDYEDKNQSTTRFDGYYNMLFSMVNRILSQKGENPFHPDYGTNIPSLISSPNSTQLREDIETEIIDGLLEDPRVNKVNLVDVTQNGNQISVKVNVIMQGKENASEFVFPSFVIE